MWGKNWAYMFMLLGDMIHDGKLNQDPYHYLPLFEDKEVKHDLEISPYKIVKKGNGMVIFARLILREALTPGRILSVTLATVGVLAIVAGPGEVALGSLWGSLSLVVAALTWALMSILLKKLPQYPPVTVTFYGVLVALVLLSPSSLWWLASADWEALFAMPILLAVLYLGVVSTFGGFCLWNMGLREMDATVSGLFFFFQPVVGTLLGWLFLGEAVTFWFFIGSALIAVGVLLAMRP